MTPGNKKNISAENEDDKQAVCSRSNCDTRSSYVIGQMISLCFIHIFDKKPFCCHAHTERPTARDIWLKSFGLLSSSDNPHELKQLHLTVGYRPNPSSFSYCVKSMFYPTNETMNFWTHFIPFLILLYRFYFIFNERLSGPVTDPLYYPLLVYAFGSCLVLLVSSLAHLFCCYSPTVAETCWFCDYGSISISIFGSYSAYHFYACPISCLGIPTRYYMTLLATTAIIAHAVSCCARRMSTKFKYGIKLSGFAVMSVVGTTPCLYKVITQLQGFSSSDGKNFFAGMDLQCQIGKGTFAPLILSSLFCTSFGTMLEIIRFPQKYYPGTFDIVGYSHQLFHLCIALTFYLQSHIYEIALTEMESLYKNREILTEKLNITWQETIGLTSAVTACCLIIICYHARKFFSKQKSP